MFVTTVITHMMTISCLTCLYHACLEYCLYDVSPESMAVIKSATSEIWHVSVRNIENAYSPLCGQLSFALATKLIFSRCNVNVPWKKTDWLFWF